MVPGNGACYATKYYQEAGQRIDIHFSDANRASVFLSSEGNLLNASQSDSSAVVSASNGDLGYLSPIILSPQKIVFKVLDASSFIMALNNSEYIRVSVGAQKWTYNAPASAGLAYIYNRCFPEADVLESDSGPARRAVLRAPRLRPPVVPSVAPLPLVSANMDLSEKASEAGGGFFDFLGDVLNGDGVASKGIGFERVSRKRQTEVAVAEVKSGAKVAMPILASTVKLPAPASIPVPVASVGGVEYFSASGGSGFPVSTFTSSEGLIDKASTAEEYTPPSQPVLVRQGRTKVIDAGQSCGAGSIALPPELQPMASYIAGGHGQEASGDSELVSSLQQKMLLLEREKESLRVGQAEQPSALSLVRVCIQEKSEIGALAERLERLEARAFESSQQRLQNQIALEGDDRGASQEELQELALENEKMRERLWDMQAQLNKNAVQGDAAVRQPEEGTEEIGVVAVDPVSVQNMDDSPQSE